MDLMSEVIRTIRVGTAGARLIRQSGRGLRFPTITGSGFHLITAGTCWLISENDEPAALTPGDVVLTSFGAPHGLSQVPCALADLPNVVMGPIPPAPGPCDFEFVCGAYRLEHGHTPRYLRALPGLISVSLDYGRHPEMRSVVDLLQTAVTREQMGTAVTVPALIDLVLVHVLRQWHEQHDVAGWPNTSDPAIATTLRQLHENPQWQWTVSRMSEAAGMPRTAFTRRFTAVVGQTPMSYLISCRLGRGAQLLRETDATLATIARRIGYSTEFAFSNAFRREYGVSPSHFRRGPDRHQPVC